MTNPRYLTLRQPLTLALLVLAFTAASAAQATFKVIHTFVTNRDGLAPWGSLIHDKLGNLYGTTTAGGASGYGTVFELSPPSSSGGSWTKTQLHSFQQREASPQSGLVLDSLGNLYGTTTSGGVGNLGTIFELTPPALSGFPWTETTLYKFSALTGNTPQGLLRSSTGTLYGTTLWGDNAYELRPPAVSGGAWKEKNLFTFNGGSNGLEPLYQGGALVSDAAGSLYGTTVFGGSYSAGNVFELSPPAVAGGSWTEAVLYSFGGYLSDGTVSQGALVRDTAGNLYGTTVIGGTHNLGTVFEISPPAAQGLPWTETLLHSFAGGATDGSHPDAGLVRDKAGNLYGVTYTGGSGNCSQSGFPPGCGTIFELSSSGGTWTETVLHSLDGTTDGQYPYAGLMIDDSNHLFGATSLGGAVGNGTVFEVVP